jgi:hypothetical protein
LNDINVIYNDYQTGLSYSKLSKKYDIHPSTIRLLFIKNRLQIRPRGIKPYIIFDNSKFYLASDGYWRNSIKSNYMLHQAVWEKHNGKIPQFFDIHHIDGNKSNNDIKNLIAIKHSEHTKINASENGRIGGKKSRRILTSEQARAMRAMRGKKNDTPSMGTETCRSESIN